MVPRHIYNHRVFKWLSSKVSTKTALKGWKQGSHTLLQVHVPSLQQSGFCALPPPAWALWHRSREAASICLRSDMASSLDPWSGFYSPRSTLSLGKGGCWWRKLQWGIAAQDIGELRNQTSRSSMKVTKVGFIWNRVSTRWQKVWHCVKGLCLP